ncbi:MAG: hypothetical protein M0030_20680 [Actinomycetota bacterium]|nr:hypothetical protein [Actinomycetota bacterium]
MNAEPVRMLLHELLKQRLISRLLLVAVACVAARQALLSVHQVFPGGAEIGEVVYDLGIGYIVAWIFNVFVVILPRLHDKNLIMPGAGKLITQMCATGLRAVTQLNLDPAKFQNLTDAGQLGQFELRLGNIQRADTSSVEVYGPEGPRPLNWHEWAVDRSIRVANAYQSLVPFFPFFESELVRLINDVALSDFVTMHRQTAGVPLTGGDLRSIARPLADFITACRKLRGYFYAEVLMQPVPPGGLPEDNLAGELVTPS